MSRRRWPNNRVDEKGVLLYAGWTAGGPGQRILLRLSRHPAESAMFPGIFLSEAGSRQLHQAGTGYRVVEQRKLRQALTGRGRLQNDSHEACVPREQRRPGSERTGRGGGIDAEIAGVRTCEDGIVDGEGGIAGVGHLQDMSGAGGTMGN